VGWGHRAHTQIKEGQKTQGMEMKKKKKKKIRTQGSRMRGMWERLRSGDANRVKG